MLVLVAGGCASKGVARPGVDGGSTNAVPAIRPLDGGVGRIVRVQSALKFVVVDYRLNTPPRPDDRLVVYRGGEKVAELKAGYFSRETTIAADILSGDPREGDEVRRE